MTAAQASKAMGINTSTLYDWIEKYSEFADAVKSGKGPTDANVAKGLYKRAVGYDYTERKAIYKGRDETGRPILVSVEETKKHVPPDTGAACMWLKNRRPDAWRDKPKDDSETDALVKAAALLAGVKIGTDAKTD